MSGSKPWHVFFMPHGWVVVEAYHEQAVFIAEEWPELMRYLQQESPLDVDELLASTMGREVIERASAIHSTGLFACPICKRRDEAVNNRIREDTEVLVHEYGVDPIAVMSGLIGGTAESVSPVITGWLRQKAKEREEEKMRSVEQMDARIAEQERRDDIMYVTLEGDATKVIESFSQFSTEPHWAKEAYLRAQGEMTDAADKVRETFARYEDNVAELTRDGEEPMDRDGL